MKLFIKYFILSAVFLTFGFQNGACLERTSFNTSDGVTIVGVYEPPEKAESEVFVLLHGLGASKEEWNYFETKLKEEGYGFFAYDARGHGESIKKKDNSPVDYRDFGKPSPKSQWNKMVQDLALAVNFLITQKKLKRKQIGLIGASIGANISLIYGSSYNHVGTLVLLSPGLSYMGLETLEYIKGYSKGKIALVASPGDEYSFRSCEILYKKIHKNPQATFFEAESGHGVKVFDGEFEKQLMEWMKK